MNKFNNVVGFYYLLQCAYVKTTSSYYYYSNLNKEINSNMTNSTYFLKQTILLTVLFVLAQHCMISVNAHGDDAHEPEVYCTSECKIENAADPCGDGKGQQSSCVDTDFITMFSSLQYSNITDLPRGFLGCSMSICETACKDINMTKPMEIVTADTNGIKMFCLPAKDTGDGMFMLKDLAEMSALSRGCSGSHQMGSMYMNGDMHSACMDSYNKDGIKFGEPESSSSRVVVNLSIFATSSLLVLSLVTF